MNTSADYDELVILKKGWIYRQKTFFRKWKKSWLIICVEGTLKYFKNKRSTRAQKTFDIKNDCIDVKTGRQCKHLLPPASVEVDCLIEIILTGERSLKFCAPDNDSFNLWMNAIRRSQSERALPTPRYECRNLRPEEILQLEEASCWYCCFRKNRVEPL